MKIGILTLTLHTNYGGILQTYALQQILKRYGHDTVTITGTRLHRLKGIKKPFAISKRIILRYLFGKKDIRIDEEKYYNQPYKNTQKFIDRYLDIRLCEDVTALKEKDYDALIVGSDQVWRPLYYPKIENAFLDFSIQWKIKRIAYAPSFGTDKWEYTPEQTKRCKDLITLFDAVSVRELSGCKMCEQHLKRKAIHVLDPTMLLTKDDYVKLASKASISQGNLMVYILDDNKNKSTLVETISKERGLTPFLTNSKIENENADISDKIQPPLENWIRGFMDAKCVVTDSFHACVFSILFNKPFVVIGNKERGLDRFISLLSTFGLEKQLITNAEEYNPLQLSINWNMVNHILERKREESIRFLITVLS